MNRIVYVEVDEGVLIPCVSASDLAVHITDPCVIEVDRILEFGKVAKIEEREAEIAKEKKTAKLLRRATLQDHAKADEDILMSRIAMTTLNDKVKKHSLAMRIVRVRYSFDRTILRVIFTSEERVDYAAVVQELGTELRARIEMKQIGVRDEAGMIGGMGPCGRALCCCSWLSKFDSINVRMAKAQRVSLNPGAISGMCGRLKCCLRYEYDTYRELGHDMPHDGAVVTCPDGKGRVIDKDVLSGRVRVRLDDDRVLDYKICEIKTDPQNKRKKEDDEDPGAEWTESESTGKT